MFQIKEMPEKQQTMWLWSACQPGDGEHYWDNWRNLNTDCGLVVLVHQLGRPGLAAV